MPDFMDTLSGFVDMEQGEALPIKPSSSDQKGNFKQFDLPIPGQSLTQELGSAAFEQPPQYTELTEFMDYMFDSISRTSVRNNLLRMLNAGVPVRVLLEPIILQAVNEGKVNIDLALLSLRPLVYMIAGFGYHAGINVVLDYPRKDNGLDPRPLEKAFKQIREQSEAPKVIDMERTLVPEEAPKVIDMKRTLVPKKEIT
jgi:hypothetical protein